MRILITGGTGFLGSRLVERLSRNNHIYVLSLSEDSVRNENVDFITCDIRNKSDLKRLFPESIDAVCHLAANLDESDKNMYVDNLSGTSNIIEMCNEKNVRQLVFMSSSGVLGETKVPAKEDFPYKPKTEYEKSKMECEKKIISSGITFTIIRAPIILGPNEIWKKIFEAARQQYPVIGSGKNYFHLAYVDDVAGLIEKVIINSAASNEIFHIATPDAHTYEEVYAMICEELKVPMTKKHVPVFLVKLVSAFHILSCRLRGKKPKLTLMKSSIDRLIRNRIISTEKLSKLGFMQEYDTRKAIKETIENILNE